MSNDVSHLLNVSLQIPMILAGVKPRLRRKVSAESMQLRLKKETRNGTDEKGVLKRLNRAQTESAHSLDTRDVLESFKGCGHET